MSGNNREPLAISSPKLGCRTPKFWCGGDIIKPMDIQNREMHRVVSTCIIYKGGKYLITKRALTKKAWPGKWTVPGGGLEIDDYANTPANKSGVWYFALENSLRREVQEEVGLEVGKVSYLLDMTFIRPDNIPVVTLSFYAPWKSGEVKLEDNENIEYAWISCGEAKNYDLIGGIREEIEMMEKILKGVGN